MKLSPPLTAAVRTTLQSVVRATVVALLCSTAALAQYEGKCTSTDCHGAFLKKPVVHDLLEMDACDACHEAADEKAHRFELIAEGRDLCAACHDIEAAKVVHHPVAEDECTLCHDPHASVTAHLIRAESLPALCAQCHDDVREDRDHLHGPVAADACDVCHSAHGAPHKGLLRDESRTLCLSCHADFSDRLGAGHTVHLPVEDGCTDCHDPHGADRSMFLTQAPRELCLMCHTDVEDQLEASVTHRPVTDDRACAACHDPHTSPIRALLHREPMTLCLSCHNEKLERSGSKLTNIARTLETATIKHGPIQDGDCAVCHRPHAGSVHDLLTGPYPPRFYASFSEQAYELCFGCHDAEMALEPETEDATGFRNGSQNLHYLHVHKQDKGRTCRACHNVHASRNPKLIAERVPFGEWEIPLNFAVTPTGGSCQPGCHRPYRYDRKQPVPQVSAR